MSTPVPVFFYVPSPELVAGIPASCSRYWDWIHHAVATAPAPLGNGSGPCPWLGPYNWTVQTFLQLRDVGFSCILTATLPDAGIVVTHGDFLPPTPALSRRRFIVEIKPDRPMQCAFANFLVVQNENDPVRRGLLRRVATSAAVPYWPQPGLIPRSEGRGRLFENVGFVGRSQNFLSDAGELARQVADLGLTWTAAPVERWHDYSELDAVVAVRPAAPSVPSAVPFFSANRKPASKLVNAWLAGVPAILSADDAFRQLRRSSLDYLEADTAAGIIAALRRLQDDSNLRQAMAENGRRRAAEFSPDRITRVWIDLLDDEVRPAFDAWSRSPVRRRWFQLTRRIVHAVRWRVQRWRAARQLRVQPL